MSATHPAYLDADAEDRWTGGSLKALWRALEVRAREASPQFAGFVLPRGARVALRYDMAGDRELMIYRREPFKTPEGEGRWLSELATFRREFGVSQWEKEALNLSGGGPAMKFHEPPRLFWYGSPATGGG